MTISHLTFVSKVTEKAMLQELLDILSPTILFLNIMQHTDPFIAAKEAY